MLLAQYLSLHDIAVFISGQLYTDAACTNGRQKQKGTNTTMPKSSNKRLSYRRGTAQCSTLFQNFAKLTKVNSMPYDY